MEDKTRKLKCSKGCGFLVDVSPLEWAGMEATGTYQAIHIVCPTQQQNTYKLTLSVDRISGTGDSVDPLLSVGSTMTGPALVDLWPDMYAELLSRIEKHVAPMISLAEEGYDTEQAQQNEGKQADGA